MDSECVTARPACGLRGFVSVAAAPPVWRCGCWSRDEEAMVGRDTALDCSFDAMREGGGVGGGVPAVLGLVEIGGS